MPQPHDLTLVYHLWPHHLPLPPTCPMPSKHVSLVPCPLWLYPHCSVTGPALSPLLSHLHLTFSRQISDFSRLSSDVTSWWNHAWLSSVINVLYSLSSWYIFLKRLTKTSALRRYLCAVIKTCTKVYLNCSDFRTCHGTRRIAGILNQNTRGLESPHPVP